MPRLPRDTWEEIRALRESGESFGALAREYGVSKTAVLKKAKAEGWADGGDASSLVRTRAIAMVAGMVSGDRTKKAKAMERAVESAAAVIQRQRSYWEAHRQRHGHIPENFEDAKQAKISTEMLRIRHQGERLAWGLEEANPAPQITITREW